MTKDVVKSTGCDLAADVLLPEERASVASDRPKGEPSAQKIINAAINRLAKRWHLDEVRTALEWKGWGSGVIDAARRMSQAPTGTVELQSSVHSRAFYYYVKACHPLPG